MLEADESVFGEFECADYYIVIAIHQIEDFVFIYQRHHVCVSSEANKFVGIYGEVLSVDVGEILIGAAP